MSYTSQPVPSGVHVGNYDRPIHSVKFNAFDSRWGAKLTEQQSNALIPGVLEAEAWRELADLVNDGAPIGSGGLIGCATGATIKRMQARIARHGDTLPADLDEQVLLCLFMACEAETDDYPNGWFGHFE